MKKYKLYGEKNRKKIIIPATKILRIMFQDENLDLENIHYFCKVDYKKMEIIISFELKS